MQSIKQQYGGNMDLSSDLALIRQKLKDAKTPEERGQIYNELKTVPYLFCEFMKYSKKVFIQDKIKLFNIFIAW
jgi:hypothetical protein